MHKINVLAIGSKDFNISLEELKAHLSFNLTVAENNVSVELINKYDVLILHEDYLNQTNLKNIIDYAIIKILAYNSTKKNLNDFNESILLPVKIAQLNSIVEKSLIKKSFNKNSSIKIKSYLLNKNEKILSRKNFFISLTEKEIQLLDLFLKMKNSITKKEILKEVWKYSTSADTHTVETHIYRLRKKIKLKFDDDNFILNNKEGYLL